MKKSAIWESSILFALKWENQQAFQNLLENKFEFFFQQGSAKLEKHIVSISLYKTFGRIKKYL